MLLKLVVSAFLDYRGIFHHLDKQDLGCGCLAMLASIVHTVYVGDALVAAEYLRRCKAGSWKKENTVEAVKCWNLEQIIDAELCGESMPEEEITMNDLVNESNACIN